MNCLHSAIPIITFNHMMHRHIHPHAHQQALNQHKYPADGLFPSISQRQPLCSVSFPPCSHFLTTSGLN